MLKSWYVENRNGWNLSVFRSGKTITFTAEYIFMTGTEWVVDQEKTKKELLKNLEEAMGLYPKRKGTRTEVQGMRGEWSVYVEPENFEYPYSVTVAWSWTSDDSSFSQRNRGDIPLTKEEVEELHEIFS